MTAVEKFRQRFQNAAQLIEDKKIEQGLQAYETTLGEAVRVAEKNHDGDFQDLINALNYAMENYPRHGLYHHHFKQVDDFSRRIGALQEFGYRDDCAISASSLEAHKAFGQQDFKRAETIFSDLTEYAAKTANRTYQLASHHPGAYLELVRKARDLRKARVKSEYTIRIASIRVRSAYFRWFEGETEYSSSRGIELLPKDGDLGDIAESSLKQAIFAMTDGKLDIEFDRLNVPKLEGTVAKKPKQRQDIFHYIDNLEGKVAADIRGKIRNADVALVLWYGFQSTAEHGGARTFRGEDKPFTRGMINIATQVMMYPKMSPGVSPNGMGFFPPIYMHEFFHTVEARFKIKPNHGFLKDNRANFPDWQGTDEIDYYAWQLGQSLPQKISERGWASFSWRQ